MSQWSWRGALCVTGLAVSVTAIWGGATLAPAVSAATLAPLLAKLTCSDPQSCIEIANKGSGVAIVGDAAHNSAITGRTKKGSFCCIFQPNPNPFSGLRGIDLSTPPPSSPEGNFTAGVFGKSQSGFGTIGVSSLRAGIVGFTFNPSATTGTGRPGTFGGDGSFDGGNANIGVLGLSSLGTAVEGDTDTGIGVIGTTDNPSVSTGSSSAAVFGIDFSDDAGELNVAVLGMSNGTGIQAVSFAPPGLTQAPALSVTCANGGPAIIANTGQPNGDIMSLDCQGNLTVAGNIVANSTPLVATKSADGRKVATFVSRQTQQTIEDVGEAQLVNGQANVRLDPAFAATINRYENYIVFITPEGMTQGTLCVAQRTAAGFVVRENQGGRSTIAFGYRIVAKPLDGSRQRLPLITAAVSRQQLAGPRHGRVTAAQFLQRLSHGRMHLPTRSKPNRSL